MHSAATAFLVEMGRNSLGGCWDYHIVYHPEHSSAAGIPEPSEQAPDWLGEDVDEGPHRDCDPNDGPGPKYVDEAKQRSDPLS